MKYATVIAILLLLISLPAASCSKGEALSENPAGDKAGKAAGGPMTAPVADQATPARTGAARAETEPAGTEAAPSGKRVNVRVQPITPSSLIEYVVAHGTAEPIHQVTYSAEIAGRIEHLPLDLGDQVRPGQLLARIDFQTLKAQADQAESSYRLALATWERFEALKGEDLIAQQQIDEARAQMVNTRAQLAIAKANRAKSTVLSSRRGVVSAKYAEKGEFVGPGTRLYDVIDYRNVMVEAQVSESQVASVKAGAAAEVEIDALEKRFTGKIDTVIPAADRASKTFTVRVAVDNPGLQILVGMSATVRLTAAAHQQVLAVPQSAVIEGRDERSVFVAVDGVARRRTVLLGAREGARVVLLQGVSAGENLIVLGHRDLVDGQPIRVTD